MVFIESVELMAYRRHTRMHVYKFEPPFYTDDKGNRRAVFDHHTYKNQSGVYLIKENDKFTYVGHSQTQLYKTLYRHFTEIRTAREEVVTYVHRLNKNKYTVRVILCPPHKCLILEQALILKHMPRDNDQKFENYSKQSRKEAIQEMEQTDVEKYPF